MADHESLSLLPSDLQYLVHSSAIRLSRESYDLQRNTVSDWNWKGDLLKFIKMWWHVCVLLLLLQMWWCITSLHHLLMWSRWKVEDVWAKRGRWKTFGQRLAYTNTCFSAWFAGLSKPPICHSILTYVNHFHAFTFWYIFSPLWQLWHVPVTFQVPLVRMIKTCSAYDVIKPWRPPCYLFPQGFQKEHEAVTAADVRDHMAFYLESVSNEHSQFPIFQSTSDPP